MLGLFRVLHKSLFLGIKVVKELPQNISHNQMIKGTDNTDCEFALVVLVAENVCV